MSIANYVQVIPLYIIKIDPSPPFNHYRYARAYTGIQFFDSDSLLPPPFTFLSIIVLIFSLIGDRYVCNNWDSAKSGCHHNEYRVGGGIMELWDGFNSLCVHSNFPIRKTRNSSLRRKANGGGGGDTVGGSAAKNDVSSTAAGDNRVLVEAAVDQVKRRLV